MLPLEGLARSKPDPTKRENLLLLGARIDMSDCGQSAPVKHATRCCHMQEIKSSTMQQQDRASTNVLLQGGRGYVAHIIFFHIECSHVSPGISSLRHADECSSEGHSMLTE